MPARLEVRHDDALLDLGSGKGRVVTQARVDHVSRAVRPSHQVPTAGDRHPATARFRSTCLWSHHAALYELEARPRARADIVQPQERGAPVMSSYHGS